MASDRFAGVQLVDDLASFTESAKGLNKKLNTRAKKKQLNPWAEAGSLSQDKYFDPDPKSGSAQWKGLLDANPDVRDNKFHTDARSFITPDEKGFKPADDAYKKWEGFAFNDFGPGNKNGPLADRIDTEDVQSFYDTYYKSHLIDDETFVGSSNLRWIFGEPANAGSSEANPNEANISPSKGVTV